jgi:hypothetical protein
LNRPRLTSSPETGDLLGKDEDTESNLKSKKGKGPNSETYANPG